MEDLASIEDSELDNGQQRGAATSLLLYPSCSPHSRLESYKQRPNSFKSNQEERRRAILIEQKKKRQSLIESNRDQSNLGKKPSPNRPNKSVIQNAKFTNQLMYSEWLEEIPCDFETNWIMVLCPIGKRCLVVASEGTTSVYNKAGKLIARHFSSLPGGNRESKIDETILDCIYNDFLRTYFVLDCLCWKSHPILDSESEFRFFWLKCKLDESPELSQFSYENPYVFKDLRRHFPLSRQDIQDELSHKSMLEFKMDGALFYHKEGHYTPGATPLVGWLKLFMIPEILGVEVAKWILDSAPCSYVNAKQTIDDFTRLESSQRLAAVNRHLFNDIVNSGDDDESAMSDEAAMISDAEKF